MKNKILLFSILSASLIFTGNICLAQGQNSPGGINEPNTGLENLELKEQNQGTGKGLQNSDTAVTQTQQKEQINTQQHQNTVTNFVQNLLQIANKENGIGVQVRTIAQEQNQSASTTIEAMERIQKRGQFKTFLIGTDYKNTGALRSEMVQTQNRLEQLNQLMENIQNIEDKIGLQNQVKTLEQEQVKIESFVKDQEGKFSLFGWLVKIFNK